MLRENIAIALNDIPGYENALWNIHLSRLLNDEAILFHFSSSDRPELKGIGKWDDKNDQIYDIKQISYIAEGKP